MILPFFFFIDPGKENTMDEPLFSKGTRVRLRSRPEKRGAVLDLKLYSGGYQYLAVFGDEENW